MFHGRTLTGRTLADAGGNIGVCDATPGSAWQRGGKSPKGCPRIGYKGIGFLAVGSILQRPSS
jgi:hypothetical protein